MFKKIKISKTMMNLQWAFISFATASAVNLLLRIVIGKELNAAGLGVYTLAFTFYSIGLQFSGFGIGAALTKYIAEHNENPEKIKEFVNSGMLSSIISGIGMGFILYMLAGMIGNDYFHIPELVGMLKMIAICFPFIAVQKAVIGTLNGLLKMKYYAFLNIIQNALTFVVSIILVIPLEMGTEGAVLGFVAPTILVGVLSVAFVKGYFTEFALLKSESYNQTFKALFWFGFYVVLAGCVGIINTEVSKILIGRYMNEVEVGYYAVSIIFTQALTLIPFAAQRITAPATSTYYGKKEYGNIRKLIKTYMTKTFIISIFITIFLGITGKYLIVILFKKEFLPAYTPMLILLLGHVFYSSFVSVGGTLSSIGKVNLISSISAISALINIPLNLMLIPKYGLCGAATATSISLIINVVVNLYFIDKFLTQGEKLSAQELHANNLTAQH